MKLIETTLSGKMVRMRFANDADPLKASEWIEFQVSADKTEDHWRLPAIQREALERAREVLADEIQDVRNRLNRSRD